MKLYIREENPGTYRVATKQEIRSAANEATFQLRNGTRINTAGIAAKLLEHMRDMTIEHLIVIYVDNDNKVVYKETMGTGIEDQTSVYPKKIVRRALLNYATGVLIAHNHPTGQTNPSNADKNITKQLVNACKALEIRFLDHLIIGSKHNSSTGYFSFRENGLI